MKLIFINKNPQPYRYRLLFGLAEIVDGAVMVLSFGKLKTTLPLDVSRNAARAMLERMKEPA